VDDAMALDATFRALIQSLQNLHESFDDLQGTVQFRPEDEAALADGFENAVLDLIGSLHEARGSALHAHQAVGSPPDLDRARRSLTESQERFQGLEQHFGCELLAYHRLRELARLGRVRKGEWKPWARLVREGIESCRAPIELARKAYACCWQELADRAGMTSISVHTTGVGQRVEAIYVDGNEQAPRAEIP